MAPSWIGWKTSFGSNDYVIIELVGWLSQVKDDLVE